MYGVGKTSTEAGRPLKGFAVFHLLSLEGQQVILRMRKREQEFVFGNVHLRYYLNIPSRQLDIYVIIDILQARWVLMLKLLENSFPTCLGYVFLFCTC